MIDKLADEALKKQAISLDKVSCFSLVLLLFGPQSEQNMEVTLEQLQQRQNLSQFFS